MGFGETRRVELITDPTVETILPSQFFLGVELADEIPHKIGTSSIYVSHIQPI